MATARIALGQTFEAVAGVATSVATLASVATKSVGMLDATVSKAAAEQRKKHVRDGLLFDQRLLSEYANEAASIAIKADEFCDKSQRHKELFNAHYAELNAALNTGDQALAA